MAIEGYVPLKMAARRINRSVARTRQFVHDGKFGLQGDGWVRDQMGRLHIQEGALAAFVPPARGNLRASGVRPSTKLRHLRVAKKLLAETLGDSKAKLVAMAAIDAAIGKVAVAPPPGAEPEGREVPEVGAEAGEGFSLADLEDEGDEDEDEEGDELDLDLALNI